MVHNIAFWAPSFELGLKYIFYIFCGIAIMISIIYFSTNIASLDRIFYTLSLFIFLEIIIALFESFTVFRMPVSSYSSVAHLFGKEPASFYEFENILASSGLVRLLDFVGILMTLPYV